MTVSPQEFDLSIIWELCLQAEYDRPRLVASLAEWLGPPTGLDVLDCASGSGFPALDLCGLGYQVTCTDASAVMLERFRRNAHRSHIFIEPRQLRWDQLGSLYPARFDVAMCRGCSLIYAGTWDTDSIPDRQALERSLRGIVDSIAPGGRLYLDTVDEADDQVGWTDHHPHEVDGHRVSFRERVLPEGDTATRRWVLQVQVDEERFEVQRRSHDLPHAALRALMVDAGLEQIERSPISGEQYAVFTARKPQARSSR
jgi:SAM-dependent methyltransferase